MSSNLEISKVTLISVPELDVNYNHTVDFNNLSNQLNWFRSKATHTLNECKYVSIDKSLIVDLYIENPRLLKSNYVMIENQNSNTIEFGFIIKREYVNEYNTKLYIKKDVIQSNLFKIKISSTESFIDQAHVNRYTSDGNIEWSNMKEDEGLETGLYMRSNDVKNIYNFENSGGGYIVACSESLTTPTGGSGGAGGSGETSYDYFYLKGRCSANGLWFIKQCEGFYATPYDDGLGYMTIGYGTTKHGEPDAYNSLLPSCTEEQASTVLGETLYNNYSKSVYDELVRYGKDLNKVKQCEFDAFVSLAYNMGVYGMTQKQVWTKYINGDSAESIADLWLTTAINAGTSTEAGLRARRQAEVNIFLNANYYWKDITNHTGGGTITENNGMGYIPEDYKITVIPTSSLRSSIVASALSLVGKPYVYGGNYPPLGQDAGTDCSGLCQWAYDQNGIEISRTTYTQINEGKEITYEELLPGDLVFTRGKTNNGHVVMFMSFNSDGTYHCVEAKQTGTDIMENDRTPDENHRYRQILGKDV